MKSWATALTVVMLVTACAKNGDGGTPLLEDSSKSKTCGSDTAMNSVSFTGAHDEDPFAAYGKVLLEEKDATEAKDHYAIVTEEDPATLSPYSTGQRRLDAGLEVSVTLRLPCEAPGEIAGALIDGERAKGFRSYTWRLPSTLALAQLQDLAKRDECVVGVSDSPRAYTTGSQLNDPMLASQGHLKMIEATSVLDLLGAFSLAKPLTIAIIDTGIEMNHEDIKNILWTNSGEIPGNEIDDDKNGYVDDVNGYNFGLKIPSPQYSLKTTGYQHGTHVSGLAAAIGGNGVGVSGVMNSQTRIMMLNVFGNGSGAYTSDVANAIRYAADNGADVINMSLGGSGRSATYESAIAYAISRGATIVAASGNEHREIGSKNWMSPATYAKQFEGMLAIGSVDTTSRALSAFSNYSSDYVELAAPGSEDSRNRVGLLSTWPNGKYSRIQGTSMASPVAAGAAAVTIAMLRARGYAPSPRTIEELIETASPSVAALRNYIRGGRVLNLRAVRDFIEKNYPFHQGEPIDPGVPGYVACGN